MREIKSRKKSGFFKKIFIKICRILGYELIDQSSLEFPVSNKKSDDTLSVSGVKSFSLGVGEFPITRKVQGIDIIVKTCTSVQLVTQNKKRIFEKEKSEYTFRSLQSLYRSALDLKEKFPKIKYISVGDGDEKKRLLSLVKELKLEKEVLFLNNIDQKLKISLLQSSNLFLMPSIKYKRSVEGLSLIHI